MLRLKLIHVSSSGSSNFVSSRLQQYNAVSIWVMLLPPLYHQQYVSIWAMLLPPLYHHCTSFGRPLASVERSLWRPLCLHSATTATLEPPWQWLCLHAAFCTRLVPLCTAVFGDSRKAHGSFSMTFHLCCLCDLQVHQHAALRRGTKGRRWPWQRRAGNVAGIIRRGAVQTLHAWHVSTPCEIEIETETVTENNGWRRFVGGMRSSQVQPMWSTPRMWCWQY